MSAKPDRGAARTDWVDYARGIGIFLVVLGHVLRGLVAAKILDDSPAVQFADRFIYSFHMPLFFFLAGLFAKRSAEKGSRRYLGDKLRTVVYPYVLWSLIWGAMGALAASYTNTPKSWSDLADIWYKPIDHFWFLYALFLILLTYLALHQLGLRRWGFLAFAVGVGAATRLHGIGAWLPLHQAGLHIIFFALGVVVGSSELAMARIAGAGNVAMSLLSYLMLGGAVAAFPENPAIELPCALLGIMATLVLAGTIARWHRLGFLTWWGQQSLPIYVAHTIFSAAFRIGCQKVLKIESPIIHLVGGVLVGIYGPLLLQWLETRLGYPVLFSWPKEWPKRRK